MTRALDAVSSLRLPTLGAGSPGDPGLFGPSSVIWRIGRERVLLLGGPAALLLQIAHPLVAAGVGDHSDFRRRPYERLRATLDATLTITFGDRRQAEAAAARVRATHARVRGTLRTSVGSFVAGTPYNAEDPELALWVHATLVTTALDTYDRFVHPLSMKERECYFEDARPFAALFGVSDDVMPRSYEEFRGYVESTGLGPVLSVGPEARMLAGHILNPPAPAPLRPLSRLAKIVAADLMPAPLRDGFGLTWTTRDRAVLAAAGRSSRGSLRLTPASVRYWPHYRTARRRTEGNQIRG